MKNSPCGHFEADFSHLSAFRSEGRNGTHLSRFGAPIRCPNRLRIGSDPLGYPITSESIRGTESAPRFGTPNRSPVSALKSVVESACACGLQRGIRTGRTPIPHCSPHAHADSTTDLRAETGDRFGVPIRNADSVPRIDSEVIG